MNGVGVFGVEGDVMTKISYYFDGMAIFYVSE